MSQKNTSFAELKGLLINLLNEFFEKDLKVRFRPSYFPFTEPSAEVDIMDERGRWLEVLAAVWYIRTYCKLLGIDPEKYKRLRIWSGSRALRYAALWHQ